MSATRYTQQPVTRIGATYSGGLVRDILIEVDRQCRRIQGLLDDASASSSGSLVGAPSNASYVTLGGNSSLTSERTLTGTTNQITVTDGGANSTVTLSAPQNLHTGANFQINSLGIGTAAAGSGGYNIWADLNTDLDAGILLLRSVAPNINVINPFPSYIRMRDESGNYFFDVTSFGSLLLSYTTTAGRVNQDKLRFSVSAPSTQSTANVVEFTRAISSTDYASFTVLGGGGVQMGDTSSAGAAVKRLILQAGASQSANIFEVFSSAAASLASISSTGKLVLGITAPALQLSSGGTSGAVLTSDASGNASWATLLSAGLAPNTSSYVVIGADAGLTAERVLTAGTGIQITDGGANTTVTILVDQSFSPTWTGTHTFNNSTTPLKATNASAATVFEVQPTGKVIIGDQTAGTGRFWSMTVAAASNGTVLIEDSDGTDLLNLRTKTTWSDAAQGVQHQWGDAFTSNRRVIVTGQGATGSVLDRLGFTSAFTLFTNARHDAADMTVQASEIVEVLNSSVNGTNASVLLTLRTNRTTQTGDLFQAISAVAGAATCQLDLKAMWTTTIKSGSFWVDATDVTKKLALTVSGVTTGTTRTWTVGNYSGYPTVPTNEGTSGQLLRSAGAAAQPTWTTATFPDSGTSGGILGYTAAGTLASSVLLTANALVLGGGAGATPTPMASLGTTTTVLHGNAAGAPTFGAVSLTADVTGTLAVGNGGTGLATYAVGDMLYASATTTLGKISGGSQGQILRMGASSTPAWSSWFTPSTFASGDLVYGSSANTLAGLAVAANGKFLTVSASFPAWVTIANSDLPATISSKTLDDTNTATFKDTNFTLEDDADTTKKVKFQLSGINTLTTQTINIPGLSGTATMALEENANTWTNSNDFTGGGVSVADTLFSIIKNGSPTNYVNFSCTSITGAKVLTLPNVTTTLAGLGVTQTFTAMQTIDTTGDVAGLQIRFDATFDTAKPFDVYDTSGGSSVLYVDSIGRTVANQIVIIGGSFNAILAASITGSDKTFTLPDITGTAAVLQGAQTFTGAKTFTAGVARVNTAGTGWTFSDVTVTTTKGALDVSALAPSSTTVFSMYGVASIITTDLNTVCIDGDVLTYDDEVLVY